MQQASERLALAEIRAANASGAGSRWASVTIFLAIGAVVVSFALMPVVYGLLTYGLTYPRHLQGPLLAHVWLNCAANALVMLGALLLTGRLDRKLAGVLTLLLIVHGGLAFLILTTRSFYSNQVMLTAAPVSALLGSVVMYLKHRSAPVRVALLGSNEGPAGQVRIDYDRILDPDADLRPYDILLTTSVIDLSPEWARVLSKAMIAGKPVRHLAEYMEEEQGIVSIDHFDLDHLPVGSGFTSYQASKRVADIALVLIALPIALPLLLAGAAAVWVTMGRPVLFVQPRVGRGNKTFQMYKLRTMRPVGQHDGQIATVKGDLRVTPLGAWLRRFRIDELPQLWNVLRGDMSIIGPRPEQPALAESYCRQLPAFAYRSLVRPGITGWAQVRAGYAADLEETRVKLGYDLFYLKNFSYALDLQIMLRTVGTLLTGGGVR